MKTGLLFLALMLTISSLSFAQSPAAVAESANVKITYGQPSKKGRVIFGGLEKFGTGIVFICLFFFVITAWFLHLTIEKPFMRMRDKILKK
jgi:hypothetical protein